MDRMERRNRSRLKLEVKKEMIDHVDEAMLYLVSDLKLYHAKR